MVLVVLIKKLVCLILGWWIFKFVNRLIDCLFVMIVGFRMLLIWVKLLFILFSIWLNCFVLLVG